MIDKLTRVATHSKQSIRTIELSVAHKQSSFQQSNYIIILELQSQHLKIWINNYNFTKLYNINTITTINPGCIPPTSKINWFINQKENNHTYQKRKKKKKGKESHLYQLCSTFL